MAFSSGTFSLYTPGNPVVTGTTISSDWGNNTLNDIATGLSTCVLKDGSQTITANIPMSSFKFTGLAAGSALTDSPTLRQVQYGFGSFLTSVAGTNTITATATPTPAYTVGQRFTFVPAVTNTGATTLNISSVGAGAVQMNGAALTGGELVAGAAVTVYVTATTPVFEIVQSTGMATQALQEAGTSITTIVTPGRQQFHPSAAKVWVVFGWVANVPTVIGSYNLTSLTDEGVGDVTFVFATDFSGATYSWALGGSTVTTDIRWAWNSGAAPVAGSFRAIYTDTLQANTDGTWASAVFYGDQ